MSAITTTRLTREEFDRNLVYIQMTPVEFAEKIGVHLSTLYRWQRAEEFPLWVPLLLLTMRHNRYLRTKGDPSAKLVRAVSRLPDALA
jgi:predicted transcriptional regulator